MTIHYHGTPITPIKVFQELAGCFFCVSHAAPSDVRRAHEIGQGVMLDNGAFSKWKSGKPTDWTAYYRWAEPWLSFPTTWAVIPDVIGGGPDVQDALIMEWPFGYKGAPVWHMDEPIERLLKLADSWPLVCIGSSGEYAQVMSEKWEARIDAAFNQLMRGRRFTPPLHMLRGMQVSGNRWPFYSVDSTDIARNHHLPHKNARKMADIWNSIQCPGSWTERAEQAEMLFLKVSNG